MPGNRGGYEPMHVRAPGGAYGVQSGPVTPLRARVAGVGGNYAAAQGNFHPVASIPGGMTMPMTLTTVTADTVQVQQLVPLYADPNGAPIPATAAGQWNQVWAAGRP
jgi:hypothetical protein